jgi:cytochrome c-type biogenesis protein CcmE
MNPVRRQRLLLVLALVVAAGIAAVLVTRAIQSNITYLYTPSEVLRGEAGEHARFRLGGMVAADSFKREPGSLEAHFKVTDGDALMPVVYTGILPDLFREKQAVIATGRMQGDHFVAEQVLAKHDETYMPKEVADKMGIAHKKHDVAPVKAQAPAGQPAANGSN